MLPVYLLLINAMGFALMLIDKRKAQKNKWRIREATLMTVAAVGGSLGILFGMRICRHKTQNPKFSIGVPAILALQVVGAIMIYSIIK